MIRVADYIMQKISECGIGTIFMVTGRGSLFLTDAVAATENLKSVCVHHEQSAAFAAVSYADYNEKLGACLVSTGCASTNTLTGVLNAWQDGIPCLFISGANKLDETSEYTGINLRTFGQQEANLMPIVNSITKYSVMITDPNKIVYEMEKAIYLAQNGRKGPVWIDVPLDVQNKRINPEGLDHFININDSKDKPSMEDIDYFVDAFTKSKRPVLLIGRGVRSSGAIENLKLIINKLFIPVSFSNSSPDIYGSDNSFSIGSVGMMGCTRAGNFAVQNSDLLVVLGSRMSTMTTGEDGEKFAREAKTIVIDIDPIEHTKNNFKIDRLIKSDVNEFINSIINLDLPPVDEYWQNKCIHWKEIFPKFENFYKASNKVDLYYLAECLTKVLPSESVFVTDSGLIELILPTNIQFKNKQRCIHPASQGSMGFALPGIIGAYYASNKPIIAVIGDGSIMMNLQELQTIRHNDIPAKIFVINNNVYAVIRKRQEDLFRSRTIGVDPSSGVSAPDFKKVSKAFNIDYMKINNSSNLIDSLKNVINKDGPVICEIMGLEDQDYISNAYARNKQKRFVRRPIEDQSPFLERDLFLSEMIIDPIDQ